MMHTFIEKVLFVEYNNILSSGSGKICTFVNMCGLVRKAQSVESVVQRFLPP